MMTRNAIGKMCGSIVIARWEVPGNERPQQAKGTIVELDDNGILLHGVNETKYYIPLNRLVDIQSVPESK